MKNANYYKSLDDFLKENKNNKSRFLLFIAEETKFDITQIKDLNISGAIFPEIILNDTHYKEGLLASVIEDDFDLNFIEDMSSFKPDDKKFINKESLIVLIDGLSSDITIFLDYLFESVSEQTQIIGSGAGKMTLEQEPIILHNGVFYKNAALILSINSKLSLRIEHGWEKHVGPFVATNTEKNILKKLNFDNAFDVYKKYVEEDSGKKLIKDNFFDISKSYPLGIIKFDKEVIVRDPIALDENDNIILVGDIPQNSTLNILKGDKQKLIDSSNKAILKLNKELNKNVFIFDCVSRLFFLEEELEEITKEMDENSKLFGVLSMGEIASTNDEYISFYTRTCVLGMLC
ncbi:FIST C-terminal domain-containing protein [Arcobacter peruensis]|uniref:FIST C-terminal domain-containing protein n=1 Tax=Arcobacter peruensis TaxID=2320140 RepID=UPI000F0771A0|nr:FIST C-terminal domain-containing protein [Arcobacter peruensis]